MPELPPGFEVKEKPFKCAVCNHTATKWYCEVCDEFAIDCGCRDHRSQENHRANMDARRRPFF